MATCFERFGFSLEQSRIKYYAITDNVHFISLENTRRNRTKYIFLTFELKCMTGIRTTLETGYHIVAGSQYVDYFTFAFVAPL